MRHLNETEPRRIRGTTAILTGLGALMVVGCGPSEADTTTLDDREAPTTYQAEDGNIYTGSTAAEAWGEENPSIPDEIYSDDYMAELLVPPEAMFKPMETSDPSALIEMFTHNMNCIADAPHPRLQQLCVRAVTGDEFNHLGVDFTEVGENWTRRRIRSPDTGSLDYDLRVIEASVPMDRPIHELDVVSFIAAQTQNEEFGGEPVEVNLVFNRGYFSVNDAELDNFERFVSGVPQTGEHRDVWILTGYTA